MVAGLKGIGTLLVRRFTTPQPPLGEDAPADYRAWLLGLWQYTGNKSAASPLWSVSELLTLAGLEGLR